MTEIFEALAEAADEAAAELYPPRPGGLVHKHRQRIAAREAEIEEAAQTEEKIEQASYKAVKVAPESPEVFTALTYTIAAGGNAAILPLNPYRYRAIVMVITANGSVILSKDSGNAISGTGFALPANMPIPVHTRAQVYAFNNTGSTVQVSVLAEMYAPEKK